MRQQNSTSLPAVTITATHPDNNSGHISSEITRWEHETIPGAHYLSRFQPGSLIIEIVTDHDADKTQVEEEYFQQNKDLTSSLDDTLKKMTPPPHGLSELEVIGNKLTAARDLLAQKQNALTNARKTALDFFGTDPIDKNFVDYLRTANRPKDTRNPREAWLSSYKAAYEARLLESSIAQLGLRVKSLALAHRHAQDPTTKKSYPLEQNVKSVELESTKLESAKNDYEIAIDTLRAQIESANTSLISATAPMPSLSSKQIEQIASDISQAKSEVTNARQRESGHAKTLELQTQLLDSEIVFALHARVSREKRNSAEAALISATKKLSELESSREANDRLVEKYIAQANSVITAAYAELIRLEFASKEDRTGNSVVFSLSTAAIAHPHLITLAASSVVNPADLQVALRTTLRAIKKYIKGPARGVLEVASILLLSLKLERDEPYGLSIPFTDLNLSVDWKEVLSQIEEDFPLPMRLISEWNKEETHLRLISTGIDGIPKRVPVRTAIWDSEHGAYRFTSEGPDPITIYWLPQAGTPENSTSLPIETQPDGLYPGVISTPAPLGLLPLPAEGDAHFNDYIVTFPTDSGLEPVYVMFKDPRDYAGVATGNGQSVSGLWLGTADTREGSPIPSRIADQLRGLTFSNWDRMREAIWKAVAADTELSQQFIPSNLQRMREGGAPKSAASGHNKSKKSFELHHVHQIAKGGAVYDIDNIVVMTPKQHAEIHSGKNNQ